MTAFVLDVGERVVPACPYQRGRVRRASLADFGLKPVGNFAPLNRAASVFEAVAMKPETRRRLLPAWASALRIARRTAPLQAARRAP